MTSGAGPIKTSTKDGSLVPYAPVEEVLAPGETLREALESLEMSQSQLAQRTGMSTKHINQIIQGQAALTHDTAILLERTTGVPARFWNSLEAQYRDHLARKNERDALALDHEWLAKMPLPALRKLKRITATARDPGTQLQQLLQFFGVSSVEAWREVWAEPAAAFLQSAAFTADAGAVAAWLRLGEIEAAKVACAPYDRGRLRELLPRVARIDSPSTATVLAIAYREMRECGSRCCRRLGRAWRAREWSYSLDIAQ